MIRKFSLLSLGLLLALMTGCGGGSASNNNEGDVSTEDGLEGDGTNTDALAEGVVVETSVSKETVAAGETFTVTCTVTKDGKPLKLDTWITVSVEEDEYTLVDDQLTIMAVGTFDVTCSIADTDVADETPASVVVTAGAAEKVQTELAATEIVAGDEVAVTCSATDAWNNPVEAQFEVQVTPDGCDIAALAVTGKKSGSYQVACAVKDGVVDDTPETLVVKAGPAVKVTTELASSNINAGESTTVTCTAVDALGNEAEETLLVQGPAEVTVNGFTVSSTKAGVWEITCIAEGNQTATTESADLTVAALGADGLQLKLTPSKPVYQRGDKVTVGFTMVDMYDNPVPGGEIDIPTVNPIEGTEHPSDFQFKFIEQGKYTFFSCVVGDNTKCDDIEAWVDDTAPLVVIDYPERGMTLNGNTTINVTGTVTEEVSDLAVFRINGVDINVDQFGAFNQPILAAQGMNLIAIHAEDLFGNTMDTFRSFYFSQTWYTVDNANPAISVVPRSALIYVDDTLFYNADTSDQANITALLGSALANLDISALLPSPVTSLTKLGCTYDVFVSNVAYDPPTISIKTADGGLALAIVITNFSADVAMDKTDGGVLCPGGADGVVSADALNVAASILIYIDGATSKLHIGAGGTTVDITELKIDLSGFTGFLLNGIISLFEGTIVNMLTDEVTKAVTDLVTSLDESVQEFLGQPIVLPIDPLIPGMNQVTLNINVAPSTSQFNAQGGLIEAGIGVTADKLIDRNPLGSIGRSSCLSVSPENFQFDLNNPEKILLAVFDDMLSELFFSFWWNRGLHLQITSATLAEMGQDLAGYGISDLVVNTYPLLPPIVSGCLPGGLLTAQLGDFYVEAEFTMLGKPVDLHMYLYLQIDLEPQIITDEEGKKIAIIINQPSIMEVDVAYINDVWKGKEDTFVSLIKDTLIPMALEGVIEEPPSFAIPTINLQSLLGGSDGEPSSLPIELPNKDLVIDLKSLTHVMGYLKAEAGILFQDPVVEPTEPIQ